MDRGRRHSFQPVPGHDDGSSAVDRCLHHRDLQRSQTPRYNPLLSKIVPHRADGRRCLRRHQWRSRQRPYTTIYTISSEPLLAWNEIRVDLKDYRYLRYRGPSESFGNVAEIEFYRDGIKVSGQGFGTPGSWYDLGNTFDKALDGDLETFFDAPIPTEPMLASLLREPPVGREIKTSRLPRKLFAG